jgi:hypothetical protein
MTRAMPCQARKTSGGAPRHGAQLRRADAGAVAQGRHEQESNTDGPSSQQAKSGAPTQNGGVRAGRGAEISRLWRASNSTTPRTVIVTPSASNVADALRAHRATGWTWPCFLCGGGSRGRRIPPVIGVPAAQLVQGRVSPGRPGGSRCGVGGQILVDEGTEGA